MNRVEAVIRRARPKDINRIYEFETQYIRELEPENIEKWKNAKDRTLKDIGQSLERTLILELNGINAGHGRWELEGKNACITSLFISTGMRGQKWGTFILDAVEKEIKQSACKSIRLSTLTHNPAQYLYDKRGYQKVKTENKWIHYEKTIQL